MTNITVTGQEAYFNEDAKFFKDLYIYGTLYYEFEAKEKEKFGDIDVNGTANFFGPANFYGDVNIEFVTVKRRLNVGIGGTTLTANNDIGKVGIGTTVPQQKLDVAGSVKIDKYIYDSVNSPGKNGYYLERDLGGIRWIPETTDDFDGIMIQNEGSFIGNV
jgi:hypothetical protein